MDYAAPVPSGLYCLHCHYNLKGLTTYRCPECGRGFNPHNPLTFSRRSTPSRWWGKIDSALSTLAASATSDSTLLAQQNRSLRRQLAKQAAENLELQQTICILKRLLIEKGVLCEGEVEDRIREYEQHLFDIDDSITEDQIGEWLNDGAEPVSDELKALQQAVKDHQKRH